MQPTAMDTDQGCPQCHGDACDGQGGQADLQAAQPEKPGAHLPEQLGFQFQPDQEQHHHDAELGEVLNADHVDVKDRENRADRDPGNQVAKDRSQPQTRGDRHRHDPGDEKDECQEQKFGHQTSPRIGSVSTVTTSMPSAAAKS